MTTKIGFVGYSAAKFDIKTANEILKKIFDEIDVKYNKNDVEIVSGATLYGIPKLVYYMASKLGYKTSGVMCRRGNSCPIFPGLSNLITVGNNWGDESETFIDYIDILYKVGGGPQSMKETKMAKEKGIPVFEFELERIK